MRELTIFLVLLGIALAYRYPTYPTDEKDISTPTSSKQSNIEIIKDDLHISIESPASSLPLSTFMSSNYTSPSSSAISSSASTLLPIRATTFESVSTIKPISNEEITSFLQTSDNDLVNIHYTVSPFSQNHEYDYQQVDQYSEGSSSSPPSTESPFLPSLLTKKETNMQGITYDQRQEGKYNIRADLENFLILLIPSGSTDFGLLDFIRNLNSAKRASLIKPNKKSHFHSSDLALQLGSPKYHQYGKPKISFPSLNYLSRNPSSNTLQRNNFHLDKSKITSLHYKQNSGEAEHFSDFIEGRTPYHIDISDSDIDSSRLHPERPVDVIPPPYPLAFQTLIKPYHLETEPTVIQTLPPPEIKQVPGSFLESLLTSKNYRSSRAISIDKAVIDNNLINSHSYQPAYIDNLPFYRVELAFGANQQYPPLDIPHYKDLLPIDSSKRPLNENLDSKQDLEDYKNDYIPQVLRASDTADFDLILGGNIDATSTPLLTDGGARCAPGRRRDSYGVCREIEGY